MLPNPLEDIARKLDEYNKRLSHLERIEGGGALTLIEEASLSIAATNIDFQNIPAIYKHLLILGSFRTDRILTRDGIRIRFNNDSSNVYDDIRAEIRHSGVLTTNESLADTSAFISTIVGDTAPANTFSQLTAWINDYLDTNKFSTAKGIGGMQLSTSTQNIFDLSTSAIWRDTAAINRITLIPNIGPNFVANSMASLYGYS